MRKITCHHQSSVHGVVVHHVERPTRPEPLVHGGRLPVQHPASSAGSDEATVVVVVAVVAVVVAAVTVVVAAAVVVVEQASEK